MWHKDIREGQEFIWVAQIGVNKLVSTTFIMKRAHVIGHHSSA